MEGTNSTNGQPQPNQATSNLVNPFSKSTNLFGSEGIPTNATNNTSTQANQNSLKNPFGQPKESVQPKEVVPEKPTVFKNPFATMATQKKEEPSASLPEAFIQPEAMNSPFEEITKSKAAGEESFRLNEMANTLKFENLGFNKWEVLPGEALVTSLKCKIIPFQYPTLNIEGTFIITAYRIMFKPAEDNFFKKYPLKSDYFKIPLGFLWKIEKVTDKSNPSIAHVDIHSKDGRSIRLRIAERNQNESASIVQYLHIYAFPDKKEYFFAFEFHKAMKELEEKYQGWKIYNAEDEWRRQGVDFASVANQREGATENHMFRVIDNQNGRLTATYPPLLLVPGRVSDRILISASKFRSKERLPVVTYYYKKKNATISRCSQPKPGIYQNRCFEDEQLLCYLGDPNYNEKQVIGNTEVTLSIYDSRPYLNAMAMRVNGKGTEDVKFYKNCELFFMDIDNIHHVRESHKKVQNLCFSPDATNQKWYSQLESSGWPDLLHLIIKAGAKVAQSLQKGRNCLIHCSDGWDRTAQMSCIGQILVDPYFRTIEGFEVLIMKEWVLFGHQFTVRLGHGSKNDKDDQKSPVFLQFLDCVHQIMHQYPFAFEFNEAFLREIAYHAYSCQFGTFLCNTANEIVKDQLETKTVSLWSYLNSQKEKYLNCYYDVVQDQSSLILRPNTHIKYMRLWEEHFLYYSWLSKPSFNLSDKIQFCKDFAEFAYSNEKRKVASLKAEVERLTKILQNNNIQEDYMVENEKENAENEEQGEADPIIWENDDDTHGREGKEQRNAGKDDLPSDDD